MNPASFLILFNIAKEMNIGHLIRTANVFGARVVVVGKRHFSRGGATGRSQSTSISRFYELGEAVEYVRQQGCELVGVEINPDAETIVDAKFDRPAAFMVGNEGEGLTQRQIDMCDRLVYIPQFGTAVSLNVNVAAAIVLHHYAHQAGFRPCELNGHKFISNPEAFHPNVQEMIRKKQADAGE